MNKNLDVVGYALSGCTQDRLIFVVMENREVKVNEFYVLKHPLMEEKYVLTRVFRIQPYNPEMMTGRTGPLVGRKGKRAEYGRRLEYEIAYAEILGYYGERGKWRSMEVASHPWDPIYRPDEKVLSEFLSGVEAKYQVFPVKIGKIRGMNIPVFVDLNSIAKGHMFVAGMTRSGKSR